MGATSLALTFPGKERIALAHAGSRFGGGRWQTAGRADELVVTNAMTRQLRRAFGADVPPEPARAAPRAESPGRAERRAERQIALDAS